MSKEKAPPQKKLLSLKKDRRNMYGESPAASRRNIALGKQRSHQAERHAVEQALHVLVGSSVDEDLMIAVEGESKVVGQHQRLKGFKKTPDVPLGEALEIKRARKSKL